MMRRVLVLYAHPRSDHSVVNQALAAAAREVPGVDLVDLYAEYPTFEIDVDREQQKLREHDVLVFQHPVYWYSSPAILKEWQDLVLEYGFAYGPEGTELSGKLFLNAVTCGARREAYKENGPYGHELRTLFQPFEQTARLCRMQYLAPFALFAAGHAVEEGRLEPHVQAYSRLLGALVNDRLDIDRAATGQILCDHVDACILSREGKS